MSHPATDARLAAAAKGFTQIVSRGPNHLITRNPQTLRCSFDTQISNGRGWHLANGEECDSAWVAGVAPWNYRVLKCDFNLFALSQFNSGQILKWLDPASGQYVSFQPMGLNWTNALNQIQQISMPQSVAAQVSDDVLFWPGAYGAGRDFKYVAGTERLQKLLILAAGSLPSTTYDTLELNFIMSVSSGVSILVNGSAWDKKSQVDTIDRIEFKLSDGRTVWSFATPRAWDSSGDPEAGSTTTGGMRLKKRGGSLYVSVRFPKAWLDAATYPIYIDPTVDYQVGTGANDGYMFSTTYDNTGIWIIGRTSYRFYSFAVFTGVSIPAGATIDSATISGYYISKTGTIGECVVQVEKAQSPSVVANLNDYVARTKCTATGTWTPGTSAGWNASPSFASVITELIGAYTLNNSNVQIFVYGPASGSGYVNYKSQNNGDGPKLQIIYTEAAVSGNPFYAYAQQ